MPRASFWAVVVAAAVSAANADLPDQEIRGLLDDTTYADDECRRSPSEGGDHCALSALQRRGLRRSETLAAALGDCQDATQGDECWKQVEWVKTQGMKYSPTFYDGLTPDSSVADIQAWVHKDNPGKCPQPCSAAAQQPA
eukprot:CAMPEP_0171180838 /NCGR_PEP_ID=MMETSP0790-20130122/13959_1 /TAXON_ID=2925 /ORGANISM="Alexandrium catenella, Strain OF101" /LENGTH=139 /DNA_ID=CAMNT_0011645775 /DNA_START=67 /DNA_END=483 /DNA_ORIENTATION=+